MTQNIVIEENVAVPQGIKGSSVNKYAVMFNDIKPFLQALTTNQSFMLPCENAAKVRREMNWYTNKFGQVIGKKFVIAVVPNGVRFYFNGLQTVTEYKATERQAKILGDSLKPYIAPVIATDETPAENAPGNEAAETPAENVIVPTETA